jgi:hypothetical protein
MEAAVHEANETSPSTISVACGGDELRMRFLQSADFSLVASFRDYVLSRLSNPDHYRREEDEEDFIRRHLDERGCTIGLFGKHELVAIASMGLAEYDDTSWLRHVTTRRPLEVAWMSATMIHPSWRGKGLQDFFIKQRMAEAMRRGREGFIAMTSPTNHYSWSNLMKNNMQVRSIVKLHESADRFLLFGSATERFDWDERSVVALRPHDVDAQRVLIGAGFVGVGVCSDGEGAVNINYAQPRSKPSSGH